jgi:hypothetical protein
MKFDRLLIIGFLAQWLSLAAAEPPDPNDCRNLADDGDRLACYDAAFGRDSVNEVAASRTDAATEAPAEAETDTTPENSAVAEFGAEQVEQRIDHLEARLAGDFTGWTGNTKFRLDNGQVWEQTKNYIPNYEPREPISQPRVTISRGLMGSYNLRVDGVKRIVQVKRIK